MKKLNILISLFLVVLSTGLIAQTTPMGINYQGVARNLSGDIIAGQDIMIKISLINNIDSHSIVFSETHLVTTNKIGLFTLIVGQGKNKAGKFKEVPWSTNEIWFELSIDPNGGNRFEKVSTSRLMAVPYAFHSGTAEQLAGDNNTTNVSSRDKKPGVPSNVWHTEGNSTTDPTVDFLGTTDCADLVIITDNEERMRITCAGIIKITSDEESTNCDNGALVVAGGVGIGKNLNVGGKLNVKDTSPSESPTNGAATVAGGVGIGDNLNVGGMQSSIDPQTGALIVKGGAGVGENLNVGGTQGSEAPDEGALIVAGGAGIGENLNVGGTQGSEDPDEGALIVAGGVGIGQNLNVGGDKSSPALIKLDDGSYLPPNDSTGAMVIVGGVGIGENLNVGGNIAGSGQLSSGQVLATEATDATNCEDAALQSRGGLGITGNAFFCDEVDVTGTLNVDDSATFNSKLNVKDSTILENTLDVDAATHLHSTLEVTGTTLMSDNLTVEKSDEEFVATFINTHEGTGDGIQIKLGKTHPAWTGRAQPNQWLNATEPVGWANAAGSKLIKDWMFGGKRFDVATALFKIDSVAGDALNIRLMLDYSVCQIGTDIIAPLGDALDPVMQPIVSVVDAIGRTVDRVNPACSDGDANPGDDDWDSDCFPDITWPGLSGACGAIFPADLAEFITLDFENVDNSLTKENKFISFVDKEDRQLGSINAVSFGNWADAYFDLFYVMDFVGAVATLDPVKSFTGFYGKYAEAAKSYNSIGVEYTSGHGDYAEWLERIDHNEVISRGDIVAVKGGMITKDLTGAEQIMAVSEFPIVLGNIPEDGKTHLGNNVAFMGQIPVKIMGSVESGDYIVADNDVPGYGIAIHPKDMKAEDMAMVVGRSWETHTGNAPKLVNTVIGVHNGDYINILQKFEKRFKDSEARLENLESKIDILFAESAQSNEH